MNRVKLVYDPRPLPTRGLIITEVMGVGGGKGGKEEGMNLQKFIITHLKKKREVECRAKAMCESGVSL